MPSDAELDQALRRLARDSLSRRAARVDVDAEYAELRDRIELPPASTDVDRTSGRTRWVAIAAAVVLLAGGIAVLAWARRDGEQAVMVPPPTTATSTATSTTPTGPATTAGPAIVVTQAEADPVVVAAGDVVTITPSRTITRMCLEIVTLARIGSGTAEYGQIVDRTWLPAPDGDATSLTYPACEGVTSDSPVEVRIPAEVPPGEYMVCLGEYDLVPGCASLTVTEAVPPTSPPTTEPAVLDVGYYGRRTLDPAAPPYFEIDELDAHGVPVRTLTADEVASLFPRHELADGSTLRLDGDAPDGRCVNQPLSRHVGSSSAPLHADLSEARSVAVTSAGLVVAGRDVCPAGTRWGDPGTRWELVTLDLAATTPTVQVVQVREPEPAYVLFEDADMVMAVGEPHVEDVTEDGRYLAVLEAYNSEQARWHVVDLENPSQMLPIDSTCEQAGDIVGPPRFLGDSIVVVARLCAPLHTGEAPALTQGLGEGEVQVEAIDLGAAAPSERIVWHGSVGGLEAHGYTRTVGLSARLGEDGQVWALLAGGGNVEVPNRTFVLHGDAATEINQGGYELAFDPTELITHWDEPPA
jgi:hypothetical protein